jgi:hypothetical protein
MRHQIVAMQRRDLDLDLDLAAPVLRSVASNKSSSSASQAVPRTSLASSAYCMAAFVPPTGHAPRTGRDHDAISCGSDRDAAHHGGGEETSSDRAP